MDTMNFQLEPAQIALRRTRQRILIADAVGLGKTLEAGILMSELIARGKGKRILVVTVKSMMTQFQKELWNRFTIPLVRLDSNRISRVRSQLPTNYNPFFYYDKSIVSIDTIKRDVEYRTHLENAWWDIIVIDEAHNVAERGNQAQRARLAKLLAERSDTLILLSATPHDGRSESFASLMNMLDPTAIANPHDYSKEDIQGLCVRRFKKDIKDQASGVFKERKVSVERCHATAEEENAYDVLTRMTLEMDADKKVHTGQLFKTSLEKSMFSSPAACIKSINVRLKKLEERYQSDEIKDIGLLDELKDALEQITPNSFSRYQKLLELLNSKEYGWSRTKDDRVVIFTERIETMRFLANHLREDLNISENAIQELYGGMSDIEQQKIVENFGRAESPIRILVASDVAAEGINLHYLSHRLIHFDIPWSLMVFQQRNGRIDRYGQQEQPDIRYLMINSVNPKIKGDMRIMEILVQKEDQAYKNIGDPTLLMGKFNIEEEEAITATAIEKGTAPAEFDKQLTQVEDEFDPFEALMAGSTEAKLSVNVSEEDTLFTDVDYVKTAIPYFGKNGSSTVHKLQTVTGVEISISDELRRRLAALLPDEAMPSEDYLRLSPDKEFVMSEMVRSMQNNLSETAWPKTQFLWKLHPLFTWINDKSGLLFGRNEAPIIGVANSLKTEDIIFIMAGTIPNRKSAPVVDEWFGLHYRDKMLIDELNMNDVLTRSRLSRNDLPNQNLVTTQQVQNATALLQDAVMDAGKILNRHYEKCRNDTSPKIDAELDKLAALEERHVGYQLSLFEDERRRNESVRTIEKIFNSFVDWVRDTLEIENNPYIQVIAVLTGVSH